MKIEYLADQPERLREVAALHLGEWPDPELGDSIDAREKTLATCCRRGEIPLGVIALDRGDLCGFALLVEQDFELRPNLSPWLAGVFVRQQHRKRGVGSALVRRIENEAKALAVNTIYLYTAHSESLYSRLGWVVTERCFHNNRDYAVMAKKL
ncbi:MAG: GNAT family N-acetyltransferase [Steroidobacteraceae bacterium]